MVVLWSTFTFRLHSLSFTPNMQYLPVLNRDLELYFQWIANFQTGVKSAKLKWVNLN